MTKRRWCMKNYKVKPTTSRAWGDRSPAWLTSFQTGLQYFTNTSIMSTKHRTINQSSGQFLSRLGHANSFSTWSRLLVYIVEIYNNTWKALCSTWVHPSTAPGHQGVSIWRDSTPSLSFSKGLTSSFYSCKPIRRLTASHFQFTHSRLSRISPALTSWDSDLRDKDRLQTHTPAVATFVFSQETLTPHS